MKISVLSLFPGMFDNFLNESIIKRATLKGKVQIEIINFRDYSKLSSNQVDDTPYGEDQVWYLDVSLSLIVLKILKLMIHM